MPFQTTPTHIKEKIMKTQKSFQFVTRFIFLAVLALLRRGRNQLREGRRLCETGGHPR